MNQSSYNSTSDLDGSLLYSLSIDDSNYATAVSNDNDFMELDQSDLMDIDTTVEQYTPEPELNELPNRGIEVGAKHGAADANSASVSTPLGKLSKLISSFQSTPIHTQTDEEESHDSSFSILSPTTLGAKLAINKPKLLMAPPSASCNPVLNDHLVDYEYDVSKFNKNLSSFSSSSDINSFINRKYDADASDDTEEYVFNPQNGSFDTFADDSFANKSFFNRQGYQGMNQMNGMHGMASGVDHLHNMHPAFNRPAVQIHHHHYYYGSEPNSPAKENLPQRQEQPQQHKKTLNENTDQIASNSQLSGQYNRAGESSQIISDSHIQNGQVVHSGQVVHNGQAVHNGQVVHNGVVHNGVVHNAVDPRIHHANHQLYHLPLPWEPTASPVERIYYMLSSYLQLIVNFIATIYIMFHVYTIMKSIKEDINSRVSTQSKNLLVEIESCRRQYMENNCFPDTVVPALERQCAYWEKCMHQNPHGVGNTSSISAETIGMIINSLIQPLGVKFFMFCFGFIVIIFGCNFTFGYLRAKTYYGWDNEIDENDENQSEMSYENYRLNTAKNIEKMGNKRRKWL